MKRIIFLLTALVLSLGALSAQQKQAVISAKETVYDFGEIKEADGKVAHTFVIENTGYSNGKKGSFILTIKGKVK